MKKLLFFLCCLFTMFSVNLNAQIADVVKKGSFYYTLDEKGKQIKSIHENSAGELQGFTDRFVVFHKGSFYATYDENFKKIKAVHENSVGEFKNAAGQYMIFIKGNFSGTYDVKFNKISVRHI